MDKQNGLLSPIVTGSDMPHDDHRQQGRQGRRPVEFRKADGDLGRSARCQDGEHARHDDSETRAASGNSQGSNRQPHGLIPKRSAQTHCFSCPKTPAEETFRVGRDGKEGEVICLRDADGQFGNGRMFEVENAGELF